MRCVAICLIVVVACKPDKRDPIGARIEPPGGLRLGMTAAEAKAAMPELGEGFGGAGSAGGESPGAFLGEHAQLIANMHDGRIRRLVVAFDESRISSEAVKALIVDHWGTPEPVRGPFGPVLEWKSAATGWRARLGSGGLELTAYRPVTAAFFGEKVAPPGTLAKLRIGMTYAEAAAAVPDLPSESQIVTFDGGGDELFARAFLDASHRISALSLSLPWSFADAAKLVAAAWKTGTPGNDGALSWSDATTGWRADLVRVESHSLDGGPTRESADLQFVPLGR